MRKRKASENLEEENGLKQQRTLSSQHGNIKLRKLVIVLERLDSAEIEKWRSKKSSQEDRPITLHDGDIAPITPKAQRKRQRQGTWEKAGKDETQGSTEEMETAPKRGKMEMPPEYGGKEDSPRPETSSAMMPTDNLKGFTFYRVLGSGNYGKVLLASHTAHNTAVAVKIAPKRQIIEEDPESATLERRVLEMVNDSPFFTHLYQSFQTKEHLYYVLEYLGGGSLMDILDSRGRFDDETVKFYAAEMICGISHLHSKYIIHRDLKPENILMDTNGHLKIADFGLSIILEKNSLMTKGFAGTMEFAAPEMVSKKRYTFAVDWWSFGVIVYILTTGVLPFEGKTQAALVKKILKNKPLYPENMENNIKDLIQQLLTSNPLRRLGMNGNIRHHGLFQNTKWADVESCRLEAPIPSDSSVSLEDEATTENILPPEEINQPRIPSCDQTLFSGFSFTSPALIRGPQFMEQSYQPHFY